GLWLGALAGLRLSAGVGRRSRGDVEEFIAVWHAAVREAPTAAEAADSRTTLGGALARRYELQGDSADLEQAAAAFTAAAATTTADAVTRASASSGLGNVRIAQFEADRTAADLDA